MSAKRVLVVEDDEPTQKLIEALMKRDGHAPTIASTATEALSLLGESEFDVIVLDLMMPRVAGTTVIEVLEEQQRRTPIVVCSAAGTSLLDRIGGGLVHAVVRKPFDIDELSAAVMSAMR
ncbi:MAG TPA: response regulator [Thermoanaerobaculia bacterium]|nr:response regulator [Thermoanaerobaculia bacterium]